ncbi:hypothetical protein ONZ45_g11782 [Pleurotus djamor]|nr:hypothetical protein ONZ45_g11782 [Pleurotus djamor]
MSKWPRLTEKISKLTCYQLDPSEVERVAGNAPFAAKELVLKMFYTFCTAEGEFSSNVAKLIRIVQVDVDRTPEMPTLGHAKVVCEMTVEEDTSNTTGHIHAGCAMFLVDICTEMPLIAWKAAERRVDAVDMGVSHSINTIFHSPAPLFPEKVETWPIDATEIAKVGGNAPYNSKRICLGITQVLLADELGETFAKRVSERIKVVEVSFIDNPEDIRKKEVKVYKRQPDMVDASGNLHTGCVVFLVDMCSALPLTVYRGSIGGERPDSGVSQSMNAALHSPAPLGTKLRVVNTTMITEPPILCARTQIWDEDEVRLIASGIHLKMFASEPKPKL